MEPTPHVFNALSRRERDVLMLIGKGKTNAEIAETLFLSPGTVRNTVSHVYGRLDVCSRGEAVVWAIRHGLVSADEDES